jgi:prepilin-type processing-associated H-X9-DG protein
MVLFGILAAAFGSLLGLAVWAFGGGALLFVGGRYIVKSPKATYWRSVGTAVLAAIASGIILALAFALSYKLLGPLGFVGVLAGAAAGLLVTWLIIMAMFAVSFGKAILAWLPTLALAIISLPIIGFLAAVLVPALTMAQEQSKRAACMSNLRIIGSAVMMYRAENNNWPAGLTALPAGSIGLIGSTKVFVCPWRMHSSGGSRPAGRTCDYFYCPPPSNAAPQTIVACDFGGNHGDGSRNVLYADGSVRRMSAGEFQAELAKPENASFAAALWQAEPSAGRTLNGGD